MDRVTLLAVLVVPPLVAGCESSLPGTEAGGPCNYNRLCLAPMICDVHDLCRQPPDQDWDPSPWTAVTSPEMEVKALWGTAGSDVWAVGPAGVFHHAGDPAVGWQEDTTLPAGAKEHALSGVWGRTSELWVVGNGIILHRAGGSWENQDIRGESPDHAVLTSYFTLNSVWGSPSAVWATGVSADGTTPEVLHIEGSEWKVDPPLEDCFPNAITAVGQQMLIVGMGFSIWSEDTSPVWNGGCAVFIDPDGKRTRWTFPASLESAWGATLNDVVAVDEDGKVSRYNGARWTSPEELHGLAGASSVCGTGADDFYVAGAPNFGVTGGSPVLHCNLTGCVPVRLPAALDKPFNTIWCGGDGTVIAVGEGGVTYQRAAQ